jgi:hypothetical protein
VVALIVAALVLVLWDAVRRQLRRGAFVVEMAGIVGFTSIALAAVSADQDLGRYIVTAGWFDHAAGFQLRPGHEQYLLPPFKNLSTRNIRSRSLLGTQRDSTQHRVGAST